MRRTKQYILILFAVLFLASLVFAYISHRAEPDVSVGIGTLFPSVFFLLLFAVSASSGALKGILKRFYRPFMILFYGGASLFVMTFIIFCAAVMNFPSQEGLKDDTDTVIVLGCHTSGMTPGKALQSRLDTAYDALTSYDGNLTVIVSGGKGRDEVVSEGESMKAYLIAKGIGEDMIIAETESHSTFDNLILSKKFIGDNTGSIAVISNEYHVPRAVMIAERLGYDGIFDEVYSIAAPSPADTFGSGIMREYFAFVKSFIFDRAEGNDNE